MRKDGACLQALGLPGVESDPASGARSPTVTVGRRLTAASMTQPMPVAQTPVTAQEKLGPVDNLAGH